MEVLNEQWVPICGYEGFYEVSDHGRIKSVVRFRRGRNGSLVPLQEKIMRLQPKKRSISGRTLAYIEIKLRHDTPRETPCRSYLVHRLVAQAFVGELFEGAQVDHIDGDHQNNHYTNLRILSTREHALIHPCMKDKQRHARMQTAAQETIKVLRAAGKIQGRYRVRA